MLAEIPYHWIDPVILPIYGFLAIRWYGLTYIIGFMVGLYILKRLAKSSFLPLQQQQVMDFLGWLVLGVVLGGRLGFTLFYERDLWSDPSRLIKIWEGGLSFHGGLLGVAVVTFIYTKRRKVSFLRVGDAMALAVTPGIFCVRLANFINGELFGRVAGEGVPWAMRFPGDPAVKPLLRKLGYHFGRSPREVEATLRQAYEKGDWDRIVSQVPLRHPSQVYEALMEGVFLGLLLWLVYRLARRYRWRMGPGSYAALFLGGYGLGRFVVEFFREPDAQFRGKLLLDTFSRGQELCLVMILAAGVLYLLSRIRRA